MHLNPDKLKPYESAYKIKQDIEDTKQWQMGIYMANAILSTVCNSLSKKGSAKQKYPEEPIFSVGDLSEKRKKSKEKKKKEMLFARLNLMAENWRLNQKNGGE